MIYRKARISDAECIHALITHYANEGLMLARSRALIYEHIRDFTVAEDNGKVIAEVRALAVAPEYTKQGIGRGLISCFIRESWDLGILRVFSLTYQAIFFKKCGFKVVSKEILPHKVWKECIECPKFPNCDETAVLLEIN